MTTPDLNLARLMGRVLDVLRERGADLPKPPPYRKGHTDYAPMSPRGRFWIADPKHGTNVPDPRDEGWGPVLAEACPLVEVQYDPSEPVPWAATVWRQNVAVGQAFTRHGPTMTAAVTRALAVALEVSDG